ncbi:MAG: response regulator transcription factor [Anaerolineaceae bacterium]|nr:response regulator transcription factor [Anaerolineaceae bacterium]
MIRILIADDHTVVRQGIRTMLEPKVDLKLVGEAANGQEAIDQCKKLQPDVVLMDLLMPVKNGLEAIQEISKTHPLIHILVLTSFSEEEKVISALKAGAKGYILKDSSPQDLVQAIRDIHRGDMWLYPGMAPKIVQRLINPQKQTKSDPGLTEREIEVIKLVAQGFSNHEISVILGVGEGTVRFHVNHILSKLGLTNRTQAALYALREGLASLY